MTELTNVVEHIDDLIEYYSDDEIKLDKIEELMKNLHHKKMEIIHKRGNKEKLKSRFIKKKKEFLKNKIRELELKIEMKKPEDPLIWTDEKTIKSGEEIINKSKFDKWVFSAGGCGTNYVRKLVEVFRIEDRNIINPINKNIITSVHMIKPPNVNNNKDFLAIYVFGDPYLSIASICRRMIVPTLNILAGKKFAEDLLPKNKKKLRAMKMKDKDQNEGIKVSDFLNKYPSDILRLKEHWDNWYNAKVNYPILFIKYETLQKSFDEIKETYGEKYKLSWRKFLKKEFIPRVCSLDKFSKEELEKLDDIYGNFREEINSMPAYWLKEPEIKQEN